MLNPMSKAAWIEALRSGKYKQVAGLLKVLHPDKGLCHCPMGVLAEVYGVPTTEPVTHPVTQELIYSFEFPIEGGMQRRHSVASPEWLRDRGVSVGLTAKIMSMNDGDIGEFYTFAEIADYIETCEEL